MKKGFLAYANESDSLTIGSDLTVENRLDRISIYGSVDITKDKEGLQYAYELKRVIDATIEVLKNENLPEHIDIVEVETVANPFN
ncbi:MAG: hypothetical protein WC665_11600 [Sulfurimonas sp.]|jgi:hypothetical protein